MPSAAAQRRPASSVADPARPRTPPAFEETIASRDLREWRSRFGRILARRFASAVARLEGLWREWTLPLTVVIVFLVGGGLTTLAANGAGEVYEQVVDHTGLAAFDQPVLDWAVARRTPASSVAVTDFTNVGGDVGGPIVAAVLLVALLILWRRWTPAFVLVPALVGALGITVLGKDLAGRARPPHTLAVAPFESSASFPSGHTLNATVLAGLTAYLLLIVTRRLWLGILGVLVASGYAVAMGLSRVWLGHHWLTDVVAGWLLGLAWVLGVVTVHRLVLTWRAHRDAATAPAPAPAPAASPVE